MKYIIFSNSAMTKVKQIVETNDPNTVTAVYDELKANGVIDPENLILPFKVPSVGIEILSF